MREETLPIPASLLEQMSSTKQNPRYHAEGSVLEHTQMVLEKYYQLRDSFDLSESEKKVLYWACLLHDTGKTVTTVREGERWRSPGHEKASVPIARNILWQQKDLSSSERKQILDLVRWHGFPLHWIKKSRDYNDLKRLGIRTDLRLLGIFTTFDFHGRICEYQEHTLEVIQDFQSKHIPRVEYELGSYASVQDRFSNWNLRHKNAAWKALSMGKTELVSRLLEADPYPDYMGPKQKVFVTIGPALSGKTHFLKEQYPDLKRIDLAEYGIHDGLAEDEYLLARRMVEFKHLLIVFLRRHRQVALDGINLDPTVRAKLMEMIRGLEVELEYLVFESSLDQLLARNGEVESPREEEQIRQQFHQFDLLHPWEAHAIAYPNP